MCGAQHQVLLEIYASWIFGEEAAAMKRIEEGDVWGTDSEI
ncbi:hypothetical protein [Salinispora oceanensis]|nr:hypothetical protein [Salinispora oceanensis]